MKKFSEDQVRVNFFSFQTTQASKGRFPSAPKGGWNGNSVKSFTHLLIQFRLGMRMGRLAVTWRSEDERQLWLSMLLDAMEEASRPEIRARPLDRAILAALRAQLALRPSNAAYGNSVSSLRN